MTIATTSGTRAALRIDGAELRVVRLPLLKPFTTSAGTMIEKVFPLLILKSGGLEGVAEGVVDPLPDYLEEALPGSQALMTDVLLPAVLGKSFDNPQALAPILEPWRGNRMTKALLEMAFWDLWARALNLPLKTLLGGSGTGVAVGVSLGIMDKAATLEQTALHVQQGYKRVKLKIKPGHDIGIVAAVREKFPDVALTVDANSAYSLADRAVFQRLDAFHLDYIEQPLAHDDLHDHVTLQQAITTPLCLDESIRSVADTRKALTTGAGRVINIKVGRVGGHAEAVRIHDLARAFAVPVWCGGMLESGVGRAHNIHLATLPNFTKPGDTSSASRYFPRDIIEQKLEATAGIMPVPAGPGTGVTLDRPFLDTVTRSREEFSAGGKL